MLLDVAEAPFAPPDEIAPSGLAPWPLICCNNSLCSLWEGLSPPVLYLLPRAFAPWGLEDDDVTDAEEGNPMPPIDGVR